MSDIKNVCKDPKKLQSIVRYLYALAIKDIKAAGITPLLVETYRSQERQNYLYCQGRNVSQATAKGISSSFAKLYCRSGAHVTWTLNSKHKNRCAVDLIPQRKVKGRWTAIWNTSDAEFKKIVTIMEKYGFEAGIKWSTPDGDHFQIPLTSTIISKTNTTKNLTKLIQRRLNKKLDGVKGFVELKVDGDWGRKTDAAVKLFRKKKGYSEKAILELTTLKLLMK